MRVLILAALLLASGGAHAASPVFDTVDTTGANAWSKAQRATPVTVAISTSTFTPNFAAANNFGITLVHASCPCTLANPTNIVAGQAGLIIVTQSATGSDLISSYGSAWKFAGGTAPTLSTTANAVDALSFYAIDATHIAVTATLDVR